MLFQLVFSTVVMPAVLAGGLCLLLRRFSGPKLRQAALPIALGAGYVTGHVGAAGWPLWPPGESTQSMFYLVIAAAFVGLQEAVLPLGRTRWLVRGALLAAVLGLLLRSMMTYQWETSATVGWWLALLALGVSLWAANARLLARVPHQPQFWGWCLCMSGQSLVLVFSHSALLGQLQGVMVAALAACLVATWRERGELTLAAALPVLLTLQFGLLLTCMFYADLSGYHALGLAIVPLGLILGELQRRRETTRQGKGTARRLVLALLGIVLILAPIVAVTGVDYLAESDDYYDYP